MDKNYVIEGAEVICEYGSEICRLKVHGDRHITETGEKIANETDYTPECIGGFGRCHSKYRMEGRDSIPDGVQNVHQLEMNTGGVEECIPDIQIPWQNTKSDVHIGNYKALLEEGWTVCSKGFGIITLITSGQAGEVNARRILEMLELLDQEVREYTRQQDITYEKYKDTLMESVLLYGGYSSESLVWDKESIDMTRNFCAQLAVENPALYGFFQRKMIYEAADGGKIDLSYMSGVYKTLEDPHKNWRSINLSLLNAEHMQDRLITEELLEKDEMFNAFLEAGRQEKGQSTVAMLQSYLQKDQNADENDNRYADYIRMYPGGEQEIRKSVENALKSKAEQQKQEQQERFRSVFADAKQMQKEQEEREWMAEKMWQKLQEGKEGKK